MGFNPLSGRFILSQHTWNPSTHPPNDGINWCGLPNDSNEGYDRTLAPLSVFSSSASGKVGSRDVDGRRSAVYGILIWFHAQSSQWPIGSPTAGDSKHQFRNRSHPSRESHLYMSKSRPDHHRCLKFSHGRASGTTRSTEINVCTLNCRISSLVLTSLSTVVI
ncbi:hypothetical protein BKA83DRAFT_1979784 [Pisolithus microcarpus]|nr:hypothetical protein BKA83DRAFT_1979784 [Pisolithus microcarpus]